MRSGAKRKADQGLTGLDWNFDINMGTSVGSKYKRKKEKR
jgi:hypothetical protein